MRHIFISSSLFFFFAIVFSLTEYLSYLLRVFLPSSLFCIRLLPPRRSIRYRTSLSFHWLSFSFSLFLFSLLYLFSTDSMFVAPTDISDVHSHPSFSLSHVAFQAYLLFLSPPLSALSLFPAYAFIRTRTCQPRLDSTKYARVSPRATLVIPQDRVR